MRDKSPPPSLDDLDAKLREAKAKRAEKPGGERRLSQEQGLSFAVRIGVELVAALMVGVGIGLLLDRWLGTTPWLLVLFFVLGAAAGMLNVFRVMSGYGYGAGYRRQAPKEEHPAREPERH